MRDELVGMVEYGEEERETELACRNLCRPRIGRKII